jgi:hypothetical protein
MMKLSKSLRFLAVASLALNLNANAGIFDVAPKIYGMVAPATSAQRVIDIAANTEQVNVTNGETVTFNFDGKQFTWKFDLYHQEGVVKLSFLAPKELGAPDVKVYVAENPDYRAMYRN